MLHHLTAEEGLPSNNVYSVIEDSRGFLWFATDDGVVKYDGEEIKIFTTADGLPKNDIFDLKEDNQGRLWLMSQAKTLAYIKNDKVIHAKSEDKNYYFTNFGENDLGIYFTDGAIYQEINDSIYKQDFSNEESIGSYYSYLTGTPKDSIVFHAIQNNGEISRKSTSIKYQGEYIHHYNYYLFNDIGFYNKDNETFYFFNSSQNECYEEKIILNTSRKTFTTKLRARKDQYDLVTNGELFKIDPYLRKVNRLNLGTEKYCRYPTSFVEMGDLLVLSSLDEGVFIFRKNNDQKYQLRISDISAYDIVGDSILVIGTKSGMLKVLNRKFETVANYVSTTFTLNPQILRIDHDDKTGSIYYLSSLEQLSFFNLSGSSNVIVPKLVFEDIGIGVRNFTLTKNDLVIMAQRSSIATRPLRNRETEKTIISNKASRVLLSNSDAATLYIGNHKSFTENNLDLGKEIGYNLEYNITAMQQLDKDNMLFGTDGQGVYVFNKANNESKNILAEKSVNDVIINSGYIMIATSKGTHILREKDLSVLSYYNSNQGLWANGVKFSDLFGSNFLFITGEGIQLIDTSIVKHDYNINIYIEHPTLIYSDTLELTDSREFSFQVKKIDYVDYPIDYYISFTSGKEEFVQSANQRISYRNLKPGTYTLKIYGENKDYNFKTDIVSKTIIIPPEFYETLVFKWGGALLALTLLFFGFQYRFKKQKASVLAQLEIEKEYASIELQALQSQLNPHFVFNCLGSIQALISEKNTTDANVYLTKFSRLMRKFLEQSTIHTTSLEEEIEINRMYLDLEKLRFKEKLTYEINIDPSLKISEINIPAVLLQPYVENAIRHGLFHKVGKGTISLNLRKDDGDLIIEIIDDGIGIQEANKINVASRLHHNSTGTKLMQRKTALLSIVEKLDFSIEVTDRQELEKVSGTKVTMVFPDILATQQG